MAWTIKILDSAKHDLKKLDKPVQKRIAAFLQSRLASLDDPRQLERRYKDNMPVIGVIGLAIIA